MLRRLQTKSRKYRDKYRKDDRLAIFSFIDVYGRKRFKIVSIERSMRSYETSRDELAFLKVIYLNYGAGDYCIKFWSKGKEHGLKVFWDGMITSNQKFIRRKKRHTKLLNPNFLLKNKRLEKSKDYIGRYMKTKTPGVWHHL